jgi:glycosyltransferase involved in cell wall biosynthesis
MEKTLTIIVPVRNEQENIVPFLREVKRVVSGIAHLTTTFLFVDDGSTDGTLAVLKQHHAEQPTEIHYLSFSRNFGKEAAIYAGLEHADSDYIVVMDVDLQDPPDLLVEMFRALEEEDVDVAVAVRDSRAGEPIIRSLFSKAFYWILNRLSTVRVVPGARDFRLMTRQVRDAILSLPESTRFSKGIFCWVVFRKKFISYPYSKRQGGTSKWSFWALTKYAIEGIVDFSETPLLMVSGLGIISFGLALLGGFLIVLRAIIFPDSAVFGWPSMVVLILAVSGIQLFSLGVVGRYVSSIFVEVKHRPIYILKEEKLN